MSEVRDSTVPCSECGGRHRDVLRLLDGAGHVVGQVVAGLHGLAELDDHHVGESVAVLVRARVLAVRKKNQNLTQGEIKTHTECRL